MGINETLKAISDPVRRDILQMLKSGKKSAGEIGEKFNLTGLNQQTLLLKKNTKTIFIMNLMLLCLKKCLPGFTD